MHFIIYISVGFIAMQLINVLLNALFRQKIQYSQQQNSELISVLIPARNEEANIAELLRSLQQTKNDKLKLLYLMIILRTTRPILFNNFVKLTTVCN